MSRPTIEELLTLMPEEDIPDDARLSVTALELRALLGHVTVLRARIQAMRNAMSQAEDAAKAAVTFGDDLLRMSQ